MNNEYLIRLFRRLNPWLAIFEAPPQDMDKEMKDASVSKRADK